MNDFSGRRWSQAEHDTLARCAQDRLSAAEIAKKLGRSLQAVQSYAERHGISIGGYRHETQVGNTTTESKELGDLAAAFREEDYDELERRLRLHAACLGWTGDPLKQPTSVVVTIAKAILKEREARAATSGSP